MNCGRAGPAGEEVRMLSGCREVALGAVDSGVDSEVRESNRGVGEGKLVSPMVSLQPTMLSMLTH